MIRTLILMRHAKSDWSVPGLADKDRPLNARGRNAAPKMAQWLTVNQFSPDYIVSSTSVRTKETILRMDLPVDPSRISFRDELYLATPEAIWGVIGDAYRSSELDGTILILGHNPGMEVLASQLTGEEVEMPTAAVLVFGFEKWSSTPHASLVQWIKRQTPKGLGE